MKFNKSALGQQVQGLGHGARLIGTNAQCIYSVPWQVSEAGEVSEPSAKRHRTAHDTGPATPALADQQAAVTETIEPAQPLGPFAILPPELLFRVLSFLSAEDLATAAPTCRLFQHATGSGVLWRRLFLARY